MPPVFAIAFTIVRPRAPVLALATLLGALALALPAPAATAAPSVSPALAPASAPAAAPAHVGGARVAAVDGCCLVAGVGDVDGDGRDDLLLAERDPRRGTRLRLLRAPAAPRSARPIVAGERETQISLMGSSELSALTVADLDGDGLDDIILAYFSSRATRITDRHAIHVLLGRESWPVSLPSAAGLRFTRDVERARDGRAAGTQHVGVAVADLDGDGRPDLVLGVDEPQARSSRIEIVFGREDWTAAELLTPDVVVEGLGRCQDGLGDVADLTGDGRADLLVRRCAGGVVPDQPDLVEGRAEWPARMTLRVPVPELPPDAPVAPPPRAGGYVPSVRVSPASAFNARPTLMARDLDGDGVAEALFEFNGRAFAWRGGADLGARLAAGTPDRAITGVDLGAISISGAWRPADLDGDGAADLALGPALPAGGVQGRTDAAGRGALEAPDAPDQAAALPLQRGKEEPAELPSVAFFSGRPTAAVIDGARPDAALDRPGLTLWAVGDFDGDGTDDLLVGTPPVAGAAASPHARLEIHMGPVGVE